MQRNTLSTHRHWLTSLLLVVLFGSSCAATPDAETVIDNPDIKLFIQEMVDRHGFEANQLTELFAQARTQPGIIEAISRPAEAKPWYEYRRIFLTPERIDGGIAYWNSNEKILAKASEQYGVDPQIIIAIIGVETRYGRNYGSY